VYGGQDVTKDVETLFLSSSAIAPPAASPPPSEIGYVDQSVLDGLPKVKTANDEMNQYASTQRALFAPKMAAAKSNADKQQVVAQFDKAVADKREELLKPLVDQTKKATADVAGSKKLLLVIDKADILWGGTDITTDVQNALTK
jgi:outer membrane protein